VYSPSGRRYVLVRRGEGIEEGTEEGAYQLPRPRRASVANDVPDWRAVLRVLRAHGLRLPVANDRPPQLPLLPLKSSLTPISGAYVSRLSSVPARWEDWREYRWCRSFLPIVALSCSCHATRGGLSPFQQSYSPSGGSRSVSELPEYSAPPLLHLIFYLLIPDLTNITYPTTAICSPTQTHLRFTSNSWPSLFLSFLFIPGPD
jgi:hypothetical protein